MTLRSVKKTPYLLETISVGYIDTVEEKDTCGILQKRALRLMFSTSNGSHAAPFFISANILPLNVLFQTVCDLMHDISANSAPRHLSPLYLLK